MASAHIEITGNGRLNNELRVFINHMQRTQEMADRLKATFDQLALGADWEALADGLGLDPVDQLDDAEAIYNMLGSVQTELDGTFINQMLGRLG